MRNQLAAKYFSGQGLEIGALHCPVGLPPGATAMYFEHPDVDKNHSDVKMIVDRSKLIFGDATNLSQIESESVDFLIANHVLEHLLSPIQAILNWARVVKTDGHLMVALPDKRFCFDEKRPVTTLDHLISDLFNMDSREHFPHYIDWFRNSTTEGVSGRKLYEKARSAFLSKANIHYHVWDLEAMWDLFAFVCSIFPLEVVECCVNGSEVIWILKKGGSPKC